MQNKDTVRNMFLTIDSDTQEEFMAEAIKLRNAVQILVTTITDLGYKKTE